MSPTDRNEASDQRLLRRDRKTPRESIATSIRPHQYGSTMPDASTLLLFAAASLAFLAIPGPSVFYIVTRSLAQGRRAGVTSMLGIQVGGLIHVVAAAVGISALLASSATAFTIVKYAGAAYLIAIGLRKLISRGEEVAEAEPTGTTTGSRLFWQGVIVNVLNPKTALFFLAFLPQFVNPSAGPIAPQMLVLGTLLVGLGVVSDGTYALVAAGAGRRLRETAAARRKLDRVSGGVFVGLGLVAALAGEPRQK
jgi:threonine/homoserine/homoserine lactone efflux protein